MRVLIPAMTSADTSTLSIADDGYSSLAQSGLTGTETITLQVDLAGVWTDVVPQIALSVNYNYVQVAGPGTYRISKPITVSPTTVYVDE